MDTLVDVTVPKDVGSLSETADQLALRPRVSSQTAFSAKVLSLNLWGIVGISKHRKERFKTFTEIINTPNMDLDFVFLQEVWSESDFQRIVDSTQRSFPYHHYFHSGVIGSGICLLSRWPIIDIFSFKYNLNGYAHKFHHGDWFGGKVVGMAKVQHGELIANLYVTHLHAEYNRLADAYLYHRVAQAFEFSQFVSHTSLGSCDYSIVAGDFNTQPDDLPYRVILYNSRLRDSFKVKETYKGDSPTGATCGHPNNTYTGKSDLKSNPQGQRIDYIMFCEGTGRVRIDCEMYSSPVWKTQSGVSVSDHEPVISVLRISKNYDQKLGADPMDFVNFYDDERLPLRIECLKRSSELMNSALKTLRYNRIFFLTLAFVMLLLILASILMDSYLDSTTIVFMNVCRVVLTLFAGFCGCMSIIWNPMERRSVVAFKTSIDLLLKFLVNHRAQSFRHSDTLPAKTVV